MANPLDSTDDVSATARLKAYMILDSELPSFLDLRHTQERRGSKASGGEDEACKREGFSTIREGSRAATRAGIPPCFMYLVSQRIFGIFVDSSANTSPRLKTIRHYLLPFPRYASSMQRTLGEPSLTAFSVQSSVPTKTDLTP